MRALQRSCRQLSAVASLMALGTLIACGQVIHIGTRVDSSPDASADVVSGTLEASDANGDTTSSGGAAVDSGMLISPPADATDADALPNADCADAVAASIRWSFSDSLDGWQISSSQATSLDWVEAVGAEATGAMRATATATEVAEAFVFVATDTQDLSTRVVTVRLLLETDARVSVKLFAQSGVDYAWADGGGVSVAPGQWVCIALALDQPAFAVNGFDASRVRRIGVAILGTQYRVYLDDISY